MSTESHTANLEVRRPAGSTDPRILMRRLQVAFIGIVAQAKRMPDRFYDLTEKNRKVSYPFERERDFIHEAIHTGATTPNRVLTYYLARIQDDMAQFNEPLRALDVCYVRFMAEFAEAVDKVTLAHGLGTDEAYTAAERETADIIPLAQLCVAGAFRRPMGVPR
jgi:hypothetical protein